MNQFQESAPCPSSSEARQVDRGAYSPLLSAALYHREHRNIHSPSMGRARFGGCEYSPVNASLTRGRDPVTRRSFTAPALFQIHFQPLDQCSFQAFTDRSPSHFQFSSPSSFNASRISQKRRQGLGEVIRELGRNVQGSADE